MWGWRSCSSLAPLLLLLLVSRLATATAQAAKSPWLTLTGNTPAVVARGGFSGLLPDSSGIAYNFTYFVGLPDTISWCDVQLTKDGVGICLPTMLLDNCTDIQTSLPGKRSKSYSVNGLLKSGWFSVDYDFSDLANVFCTLAWNLAPAWRVDVRLIDIIKFSSIILWRSFSVADPIRPVMMGKGFILQFWNFGIYSQANPHINTKIPS